MKESEKVVSRDKMLELLTDRATITMSVIQRPYTYVHVRSWFADKEYEADGFSKCQWPDVYSMEFGIEIAIRHAVINIYHRIKADGKERVSIYNEQASELCVAF